MTGPFEPHEPPVLDISLQISLDVPFEVRLGWPLDDPPPYRVTPQWPAIPWPAPPPVHETVAAPVVAAPVVAAPVVAAPVVAPPTVAPRPALRRFAPLIAVVAGLVLIGLALLR